MKLRECLSVIACLLLASCSGSTESTMPDSYGFLSSEIELPKGFRTTMSHLGSWFVPAGEASGFHDVYTQRSTIEAFRKTGYFPDGAILVKELRAHTAQNYTTGAGVSFANSQLKQWFVMIKDAQGRFPDSPLWGDGWGWALFQPGKEGNQATDYKTDCLGCHIPAKDKDWVYIEAYPELALRPDA